MSARRQADVAIALVLAGGLVLAPLAADPRLAATQSLYAFDRVKAIIVVVVAVALLGLAAWRRVRLPAARPARWALAAATVLGLHYAASAPFAGGPVVDGWEQAARALLPLAFVALVATECDVRRPAALGIRAAATLLALLVLAEVAGLRLPLAAQDRPAATLMHRNDVAFQLAAALPLLLGALVEGEATLATVAELALVTAAIAECRSRTAWIAAAVAVALLATVHLRTGARGGARRRLVAGAGVGLALVLGLSLAPKPGLEPVATRLKHTLDLHDAAMEERYTIFGDALALIAARPLAGHGAGSFALARLAGYASIDERADALRLEPSWGRAAHGWLVAAEAGLPGVRYLEPSGTLEPLAGIPALASGPQLSTDGRTLAFAEPSAAAPDVRRHHVRVLDRRSGRTRFVGGGHPDERIGDVTFAPDGDRLVYARDGERGRGTLVLVDLARGVERTLAGTGGWAHHPRFADDDHVYFYAGDCLAEVSLAGVRRTVRCLDATPLEAPVISPDGAIATVVRDGACGRVLITERDGRPAGTLPHCTRAPVWRRDGLFAFVAADGAGERVVVAGAHGPEPTGLRAPSIARLDIGADDALVALVERPTGQALVRLARPDATPETVWQARAPRRWPWADHPHCDLLAAAFEAGLPALVALIALFVALAAVAHRAGAARLPWSCVLAAFAVLGTTNAPLALPPSALAFWAAAAALLAPSTPQGDPA